MGNKERQRVWYSRNAKKKVVQVRDRRRRVAMWLREVKADAGCRLCGEKDPVVLDFHHIDPATKLHNDSRAINISWGLDRIRHEMTKCMIVCANCHRRIHAGVV